MKGKDSLENKKGPLWAMLQKVEGDKVTFEYVNDTAVSVKVMGSFDNWETGISMTKNETGLWTATLENLPYGIY